MQTQITDPNLAEILNKLKPFGFSFHGYDESGIPLVVAPNGQVVDVNVAINFANEKINNSDGGGNMETPPEMPQMPANNPESSVETVSEKETTLEKSKDQAKNSIGQIQSDFVIKQTSPEVNLKDIKPIKPYGDGFEIKSFNPSSASSVSAFVDKNVGKNNKSSDKWLATMFKKFLEENKVNSQ